jgi:hypothetical protein
LGLAVIKVLVIDRTTNPLRRPALDAVTLPLSGTLGQNPLNVDFAGGIRLHGFDLSTTRLPADGSLDVAWYVSRWAPGEARYWPAFRIEDAAGVAWHDPGYLPPRWHREPPATGLWPLDQYAQWARHVALLPGTPPGTYTLTGEVFDLDTLQLVSALDEAGNAAAPRLDLATLTVERPERPWRLETGGIQPQRLGPITLLGTALSQETAQAGDTVGLAFYWRSEAATITDQLARLALTAQGTSRPTLTMELAPANGYGLSQWQPGDQWRGQHRLRLPADMQSGEYTLTLSLPGSAGAAEAGRLQVSAPPRRFAAPESATPVGAAFEGVGVLAGFTLTQTQETLALALAWQATTTPQVGYHVFVHLEGEGGRVWAQSDGVPAGWNRPTTGWLSGEYVLDEHRLALPADLPAGTYTLYVGLYDPMSGERLAATGPGAVAESRVAIGQIGR